MDFIDSVKQGYNQYGSYFSSTRRLVWPDTAEQASFLKKGDTVLDVGCGNGRLLLALPQGVNYTGLDFSSTLLNEARHLHHKTKFVEADITSPTSWDLPQYDAIFSIAVLHHLDRRSKQLAVLKQIRSHLKPGGFVYISVWNLLQPKYWPDQLRSMTLKLHNSRFVLVPFMNQWQRFCFTYDKKYLQKLCQEAGFSRTEITYKDKFGKTANVFTGVNLTARLET